MKTYVITMMEHAKSCEVADRCIRSGEEHGVDVTRLPAVTAEDNPETQFDLLKLNKRPFLYNNYSRPVPCMATFLSHRLAWLEAAREGYPVLVLEHDAVFKAPLPAELDQVTHVCNLARPSFGYFDIPAAGLGAFRSKPGGYLGGAHGYYVTPAGAEALLADVHNAEPADLYINRRRLPELQEYYPWPIECEDSFSTIQHHQGCLAKHNKVRVID